MRHYSKYPCPCRSFFANGKNIRGKTKLWRIASDIEATKVLLVNIVIRAILDLAAPPSHSKERNQEIIIDRQRAKHFFLELWPKEPNDPHFTFSEITDALDINKPLILEALRKEGLL